MNKKILFFTGAMGRGGAERVISILADDYVARGWDVCIATLLHSQVEYALDPRVRVVDLSPPRGIKKGLFGVLSRVRRLVREERPTVSVAFMAQICLLVGLALGGRVSRVVMSERIDPAMVHRNGIYRAILHGLYARSQKTVLQTGRALYYFPKNVQKNGIIIPNPVRVLAEASDTPVKRIVSAGRLEKQKNQQMLIRAFAQIHKDHPDWRLDVYGEGPLRKELQELIDEHGLSAFVGLPGNHPALHEEIKDAALFVLPSNFEGLSNALLEAMMMGLPCISTNCAGSDEAIADGENGLLIPVGDEAALVRAMREMIEDPDRRAALGRAAKEGADRYRVENVIAEWRKVIEGEA